MINKILTVILISWFIISCSSAPPKEYTTNEVEKRADKYVQMADFLRQRKLYKDSHTYYKSAADLYFLIGNKIKYVLTNLKKAIIYLKQEEYEDFDQLMIEVTKINNLENLKLDNEINYIEARYYYKKGEHKRANQIINKLIDAFDNNLEKRTYYQAFLADQNIGAINKKTVSELADNVDDLDELYRDKELQNIEILTYSIVVLSRSHLHFNSFKKAANSIEIAEKLYSELELTSQMDKVYQLYITLYTKTQQQGKKRYYQNLLKKFHQLNNESNN